MKTSRSRFFGTLLLITCTAIATAQEPPFGRRDMPPPRTITVTGTGEVNAPPDQATVRLGATAQAEEAAAAQRDVNAIMDKALAAIEKAGIARKNIRTTGLTLTPIYAPEQPKQPIEPRVVAYRAGNTIEVTVNDLKLVGKVIDAGLGAGANRLEGVSFTLENDLEQRRHALTKAVEEARAKAETIANTLDVPLGDVREVMEGGVSVMPRYERLAARGMMAEAAMSTPVEPGEVRVQASVTIHYNIGGRPMRGREPGPGPQ
jgi:uncharacterized protein